MIHGLDTRFLVAAEVAEHSVHHEARAILARLVGAQDQSGLGFGPTGQPPLAQPSGLGTHPQASFALRSNGPRFFVAHNRGPSDRKHGLPMSPSPLGWAKEGWSLGPTRGSLLPPLVPINPHVAGLPAGGVDVGAGRQLMYDNKTERGRRNAFNLPPLLLDIFVRGRGTRLCTITHSSHDWNATDAVELVSATT